MISIKRITTKEFGLYRYMEQLLIDSFPVEEYRDLPILREYTDNKDIFYNNIIFSDEVPVGFISYWDLESFYYVEHFAIDSTQRNGGYGKKLLAYLTSHLKKPIALEVELPSEEMAQRRINFYERHGFTLWETDYFQPPYRIGATPLPMYLMAYGDLECKKDFEAVKLQIHRVVYGVE